MSKRGRRDLIDELFELHLQSKIPSPPNLSQEDYEAIFSWLENQLKACVAKGNLRFSLSLCTRLSDSVPLILEAFCKKAADWSEALRAEKVEDSWDYELTARKSIVSFLQDCLKRFKALHEGIEGEFHKRTCLYHFDFTETFGSNYRIQRAKIAEGIID